MGRSSLFIELKSAVEDANRLGEPMDTEKYNPPHRPAGFSPYDAVVPLYGGGEWTEDRVEELLEECEVQYDRITGVGPVDDPRLDGDALAYVSLREYNP